MLFLLLLWLLTQASASTPLQLSSLSCLYIQSVSFFNQNGPKQANQVGGYSLSSTWRSALPNIVSAGLSMYQIQTDSSNNVTMDYMVQLQNLTTSGTDILFNPIGSNSEIVYISFTIIVNTESVDYLQLITETNTNTSGFTGNSQSWNAASSKFTFSNPVNPNIQIYLFLTSIIIDYGNSPTWIYFYMVQQLIPSSSNVQLTYTTTFGSSYQPTIYSSISYVILLINRLQTYPNIGKYYIDTKYLTSSNININNFDIPGDYFGNLNDHRCIYGIRANTKYQPGPSGQLAILLDNDVTTDSTTSLAIKKFNHIRFQVLCLGSLPPNSSITLSISNPADKIDYVYDLCANLMSNCLTCRSKTQCITCESDYFLENNNQSCTSCSTYSNQCINCNQTACLECSDPYTLDSSNSCALVCNSTYSTQCINCNQTACLECSDPYTLDSSNSCALVCNSTYSTQCISCNQTACLECSDPYTLDSSNSCALVCSSLCTACVVSSIDSAKAICSSCVYGYNPINETISCQSRCGDGMVVEDVEQCDDGNEDDQDGCNSQCEIQEYFSCFNSVNQTSVCSLSELKVEVVGIVKDPYSNSFTLTLFLEPERLKIYDDTVWSTCFKGIQSEQANYELQSSRLRINLPYTEDIANMDSNLQFSCQNASQFMGNISTTQLALPNKTLNNLALQYYPEITYTLSKLVPYISMAVAGIALLLLIAGYFGAKLVALEGIAVVQLSALLLLTQKDMGPTFDGLKYLKYSLGIYPLSAIPYFNQYSDLPVQVQSIFCSRDSISSINAALVVVFLPLMVAIVLKILSNTKYSNDYTYKKAYKYALGTFTFYGLLFLAYGQFSSLALITRNFQAQIKTFMGLGIGAFFSAMFIGYIIALNKYPRWFGSFKSQFFRFDTARYRYTISSIERIFTAAILSALSPGVISAGIPCVFILAQIIYVCVSKPYVEGASRRPLALKIIAIVICCLFVAASMTSTQSLINQLIPGAVLCILAATLLVSIIASISTIKEHCISLKEAVETDKDKVPPLTVEEGHRLLFQEMQRKILLDLTIPTTINQWRPPVSEDPQIANSRWQKYAILYSLDRGANFKRKNANKLSKKSLQAHEKKEEKEVIDEDLDEI